MESTGTDTPISILDTFLKYSLLLWKHKTLVIVLTTVGTILVFAFCLISVLLPPETSPMPNIYIAEALLLVDTDTGNGGLGSILASYGMNVGQNDGGDENVNLILTILQSRHFLDRMIEEFDIVNRHNIKDEIKTNSRRIVRNNSEYVYDPTSSTLTLSYSSIDPEYASRFVNKQIELLEIWYSEFGGLQVGKEMHLLETQLSNQEAQIAVLEDSIKAFQRSNNTLSIEDLAALQNSMIAELRSQRTQIDHQIQSAQQFSQAQVENENLRYLNIQRNNLDYLISQLEQGYSGGEKIMPSIEEIPDLAIQFDKLRQEMTIQTNVYQSLKEQYELTKLSQQRDNFFSIMETAEIPESKDSPRRSVVSIVGAILSFLFSVVVVLILELSGGFIRKVKDKIANDKK